MNVLSKGLLLALMLILLTGCFGNSSQYVVQKQVIPGELPDPSVIEVNGVFYATGSSNNWGGLYPIYQSTDLQNWEFVNYVFNDLPEWTINSYWAPELFHHNGIFYCYYTARSTEGVSSIGVAITEDINDGFEDKGIIVEWGNEAIDAFVLNEEGKLYITWKAYGLTREKPIQLLGAELSTDGLSVIGDPFVIVTAETDIWEKGGIEGQSFIRHNGYLYLIYSGNACCGASCDYKVGVARAKSIHGPWEKYEANPIMTSNDIWKCPGHGTAVQTNGNWYYLYHAYHNQGFPYMGRSVLLSQFFWDNESGWPFFKVNQENIDSTVIRNSIYDDFTSGQLNHWWRYDVDNKDFTASSDENNLTLKVTNRELESASGPVMVVIPEYSEFSIETEVVNYNDALKGITLYTTKDNSVGLGVQGQRLVLWKNLNGELIELNNLEIGPNANVKLKAEINDAHIIEFYYMLDDTNWNIVDNIFESRSVVIGDNLAWWSWGVKAGIFIKPGLSSDDDKGVFSYFSIEY